MIQQKRFNGSLLRIGGAFTAVFSLAMALLVLFAIPSACSFVGGFQLIILGLLFVIGLLVFISGQVLLHHSRKGN